MVVDKTIMEKAITEQVIATTNRIAKEEIEEAQKRVHERVMREVDSIALSILRYYDVQSMNDRIVITVKKEIAE